MSTPEYRPPAITVEGLLASIESLPDPPPTYFLRFRRCLWWAADHTHGQLRCWLEDVGWHLPGPAVYTRLCRDDEIESRAATSQERP